jgi:hypothetical protein
MDFLHCNSLSSAAPYLHLHLHPHLQLQVASALDEEALPEPKKRH